MKPELEILHFPAEKNAHATPLLFLHGAYTGAWSWVPFLTRCAEEGFDSYALSFRGHAGSKSNEHIDSLGIEDFVDDVATAIERLPSPPVIVAHSMGGYVAQIYLADGGKARALALLSSVAPYGVGFSAWYLGVSNPKLLIELNRFQHGLMTAPQTSTLKELLFSPEMPEEELALFALHAQPESQRALNEMLVPQPWRLWTLPRLPALVLAAGDDKIIPPADTWATANALGVLPEFMPGMGHAMMLDAQRDTVLERLLLWLKEVN
ncbi:Lysophospholipase, alpha-beta hydrolase superfamily [Formivibrio citricus]|uniref:Lysophospholipase, alpha-beta hydrolase superfamily n=1 Tax=Formivibrio citricus TaxID=83765 RepID=A0A1I4XHS2_9NEIS|nr:alpha/beta fold hydrolase [Formivibrio citricus]SFN25053.1 Lysophospholipase, alpha-beta hydrolase superfamily [Formivibrio citricus]